MNGRGVFAAVVLALALVVAAGASTGAVGAGPESPLGQGAGGDGPLGSASVLALPGNTFTYQGYLTDGGVPANGKYDFAFSLYADLAGTQWVTSAASVNDLQVTNGLFTAPVDLTDSMYGDVHFYLNGEARYLKVYVRPGASSGSYTGLTPLQPLTPAPYAQALPGLHTVQNSTSANVVGGYFGNSVNVYAVGATISGGGNESSRNTVNASYGAVGGGQHNTAGQEAAVSGGVDNTANGSQAAIGGGGGNSAGGTQAVVAGGGGNVAAGQWAAIGGGDVNYANATASTVAGGEANTTDGQYAAVPGGRSNYAGGNYSLAAGRRAKAYQAGSFVWADSTDADFASTAVNQFRVRATAGAEFIAGTSLYAIRGENTGTGDGVRGIALTTTASDAGVYAYNGGSGSALYANSGTGTYAGYFMDSIYVGGSCVGCTVAYVAVNGGDQPLEAGDLAAAGGVDGPLSGASAPVLRVRRAGEGDAVVGVVESRAILRTSEKEGETIQGAERTEGAAAPGEYLIIVISGVAEVKVDAGGGAIAAGQRLTAAGNAGHARALKSVTLEGIEVAEGAPQVGIALAPLESGAGLVPVLVTLR
jgi:hypothetical protein